MTTFEADFYSAENVFSVVDWELLEGTTLNRMVNPGMIFDLVSEDVPCCCCLSASIVVSGL